MKRSALPFLTQNAPLNSSWSATLVNLVHCNLLHSRSQRGFSPFLHICRIFKKPRWVSLFRLLLLLPISNLFIHGPGFRGLTPHRQILPENLEKRRPQKKQNLPFRGWRLFFNFIAAIVQLNVHRLVSEAELMCPCTLKSLLLLFACRLTTVEVDDVNNHVCPTERDVTLLLNVAGGLNVSSAEWFQNSEG